jgi:hypothetical protein
MCASTLGMIFAMRSSDMVDTGSYFQQIINGQINLLQCHSISNIVFKKDCSYDVAAWIIAQLCVFSNLHDAHVYGKKLSITNAMCNVYSLQNRNIPFMMVVHQLQEQLRQL